MARGIMCVMMSGEAAGCQADRAGRVALGLGTGGGQSIPAAVAAHLNVAFRCGNSFRVRFLAHFVASLARYTQSMRNMAPTRNSGPEITTYADQCIRPQVLIR